LKNPQHKKQNTLATTVTQSTQKVPYPQNQKKSFKGEDYVHRRTTRKSELERRVQKVDRAKTKTEASDQASRT
jgi:hypothetical protein